METTKEDMQKQLLDIVKNYKEDIDALDGAVCSWATSNNKDTKLLCSQLKKNIKNQTDIEIRANENNDLLIEVVFCPIKLSWTINNQKL